MILELGTDQQIANPTLANIQGAIAALPGGPNSFAILVKGECNFVQVCGTPTHGFILEYQDDLTSNEHFQCIDKEIGVDEILVVLEKYLSGNLGWLSSYEWKRIPPEALGDPV